MERNQVQQLERGIIALKDEVKKIKANNGVVVSNTNTTPQLNNPVPIVVNNFINSPTQLSSPDLYESLLNIVEILEYNQKLLFTIMLNKERPIKRVTVDYRLVLIVLIILIILLIFAGYGIKMALFK